MKIDNLKSFDSFGKLKINYGFFAKQYNDSLKYYTFEKFIGNHYWKDEYNDENHFNYPLGVFLRSVFDLSHFSLMEICEKMDATPQEFSDFFGIPVSVIEDNTYPDYAKSHLAYAVYLSSWKDTTSYLTDGFF